MLGTLAMSFRLPRKLQDWLYGFVSGMVMGGAQSALAATAGKVLGIGLSLKEVGVFYLAGVITHGLSYLAKNPLPSPEELQTQMLYRSGPPTTPTNQQKE